MTYDVIIIGAGAMGSSSAYFLSRKELKVALVEQFELGHSRGSSHGESRIIRMAYNEEHFAQMMPESYRLWENIESISGKRLIRKTGGLDFGNEQDPNLQAVVSTLRSMDVPHELLDSAGLRERFPGLKIDDEDMGVYQPDAGVINASLSVKTLQTMAREGGVEILERTPVEKISFQDGIYTVSSGNLQLRAKKVVLSAGAWTKKLLKDSFDIDIVYDVWKLAYAFWKISDAVYDNFPIFIHWGDEVYYGFPENEENGSMKISIHISNEIPIVDPDRRTLEPSPLLLEKIQKFIDRKFNGLSRDYSNEVSCLYSMTPDENFLIDEVQNGLFIATGFSGHGFKFTPVIGRIVSDMVLGNDIGYDLSKFKITESDQ